MDSSWNLIEIGKMDSRDGWTGPDPKFINLSDDRIEGEASLEVQVDIDKGRHLRIERNFINIDNDGLENMMGMGMVVEDFSPYRTISFSFKADIKSDWEMIFRIWDQTGGWLDWTIPTESSTDEWITVTLSVPPMPGNMVDTRRIGGIIFEIQAYRSAVKGFIRLDNIQFITDTEPGIPANSHAERDKNFEQGIAQIDIQGEFEKREVHLAMNVSSIGITLFECDGLKAISQLAEEMERLKDVEGLEIFFGPETTYRMDPEKDAEYFIKSREALIQVAEWCEQNNVKFYLTLGAEGNGFLPLETVFAVLDTAPKNCIGMLAGEASVDTNHNVDYIVTIMERLLQENKRMLYFNQSSYWIGIMHPHGKEFVEKILAPRFKDTFVPMWENLLPSAQGLCFGTVLGLWRGKLSNHWGVSAQSWGYTNMNFGGTSDMPGDWWLRMFLSTVAAGATYIEIEPSWPFDGENTNAQIRHTKQWAHNLVWVGRMRSQVEIDLTPCDQIKALIWFTKLLKSGIVRPPIKPEYNLSLPDVTLKVTHTDNTYKWGMIRRALDDNWWQASDCPTCWEMSVQVPDDEIFRYLYNSSHFYDQTIPENPYGIVSIVPENAEIAPEMEVLETDAYGLLKDGEWLGPDAAKDEVVKAYMESAKSLPFRASGCYISAAQVGPNDFIVYLIDPEERFPVGVEALLEIQMEGSCHCRDAITEVDIPIEDGKIKIDIAPGGYRVLHICFN